MLRGQQISPSFLWEITKLQVSKKGGSQNSLWTTNDSPATSFWRIGWSWKGTRVVVLDSVDDGVDSGEGFGSEDCCLARTLFCLLLLLCHRSLGSFRLCLSLLIGAMESVPFSIPSWHGLWGTTPSLLSPSLKRVWGLHTTHVLQWSDPKQDGQRIRNSVYHLL